MAPKEAIGPKKIAGKPLGGDLPAIHGTLKIQRILRGRTFQNIKPDS
jgi:hypothetical protein